MKRCSLRIIACGSCRHPEFLTQKNGSFCLTDSPSFVGVIEHPDEGVILFDTGYDQAFFEATSHFPERFYSWMTPVNIEPRESAVEWLKRLGYTNTDVRAVIISHFHGDHIAGLKQFPSARIFCSKAGVKSIHSGGRFKLARQGLLPALVPDDLEIRATYFEDCANKILPPDFSPFLEGADLLGDGSLLAVELPGHCSGHWGLTLRIDDDRFVFLVADAAWSIKAVEDDNPPPAIVTMLLGDTKRYRATLSALNQLEHTKRDTVILPSHCTIAVKRFEGDE